MTRILHTADWHLGARLVDQDRSEEHALFLSWLLNQLQGLNPQLLLVAGDIFDSANPPQQALRQYYDFLAQVSLKTTTRVLILGGNHDSALTLQAPGELLRSLRIDVFGHAPEDPESALVELEDAVICAVPFLRQRDIRRAAAAETYEEVEAQIREGIAAHYRRLHDLAAARAEGRAIIATGHLTAVGADRSESERDIHVGNLGAVGADCFSGFHYVALGHLHRPQSVEHQSRVRYAGSPIPLSFEEAGVAKQVLMVEVLGTDVKTTALPLPCFRHLHRCTCAMEEMRATFAALPQSEYGLPGWVELTVQDDASPAELDERVQEAVRDLPLRVLKTAVQRNAGPGAGSPDPFAGRSLTEVQPPEVFAERLRRDGIEATSEEGQRLTATFHELLSRMEDARVSGEGEASPQELFTLEAPEA